MTPTAPRARRRPPSLDLAAADFRVRVEHLDDIARPAPCATQDEEFVRAFFARARRGPPALVAVRRLLAAALDGLFAGVVAPGVCLRRGEEQGGEESHVLFT